MFRSLQHVVPSHLADTELFDFKGLQRGYAHGIVDDYDPKENKMPEMIDILSV